MNLVDIQTLDTSPVKSVKHGPFYPRASGLYKDCMRQLYLCTKLKVPIVSWVDFSLKVIFEIGNAVHHRLQNTDIILGDNRYGFWECTACKTVSEFGKVPSICSNCKASPDAFVYKEYEIRMTEPYYLTGHPDMFRMGDNNYLHVLEIKTIDGMLFDNLNSPNIEHVWQIQAYMWACSRAKLGMGVKVSPNIGHILYISKSKKAKTLPTKTFQVKNDAFVLNTIKKKLRDYKTAIEQGITPKASSICINSKFDCYQARNCDVASRCKLEDNIK